MLSEAERVGLTCWKHVECPFQGTADKKQIGRKQHKEKKNDATQFSLLVQKKKYMFYR